jgi:hypothetical protein
LGQRDTRNHDVEPVEPGFSLQTCPIERRGFEVHCGIECAVNLRDRFWGQKWGERLRGDGNGSQIERGRAAHCVSRGEQAAGNALVQQTQRYAALKRD